MTAQNGLSWIRASEYHLEATSQHGLYVVCRVSVKDRRVYEARFRPAGKEACDLRVGIVSADDAKAICDEHHHALQEAKAGAA